MSIEIIRIQDRVKLGHETLKKLIADYIKGETGRSVSAIELHNGRDNSIGAATVYLAHED